MNIKYLLLVFFLSLIVLMYAFFVLYSENNSNPILRISYLDVGQGDSTLIQTPGGNVVLIDVGFDGRILDVLGKELKFYEKDIDAVFLTHADLDHVGGIISVLDYFNVSNIFISTVAEDTEIYDAMYKVLEEYDDVIVREIDGKNEVVIDNEYDIKIDVLFPNIEYGFDDRNDKSLFMSLAYEDVTFLFTGDASKEIEEYVFRNMYESLESNILKIGHHGSDTSTSLGFIKAVNPEYGIISSGKDNDYGHPHREVLNILKEESVEVLRTDELGTVSIISDGKSILIE